MRQSQTFVLWMQPPKKQKNFPSKTGWEYNFNSRGQHYTILEMIHIINLFFLLLWKSLHYDQVSSMVNNLDWNKIGRRSWKIFWDRNKMILFYYTKGTVYCAHVFPIKFLASSSVAYTSHFGIATSICVQVNSLKWIELSWFLTIDLNWTVQITKKMWIWFELEIEMNWIAILNELQFFFQFYFHISKLLEYIMIPNKFPRIDMNSDYYEICRWGHNWTCP